MHRKDSSGRVQCMVYIFDSHCLTEGRKQKVSPGNKKKYIFFLKETFQHSKRNKTTFSLPLDTMDIKNWHRFKRDKFLRAMKYRHQNRTELKILQN